MNFGGGGPSMQRDFLINLDDRSGVSRRILHAASWAARVALATAFLSAVADRFGLWGAPGTAGVSWGNIERYNAYVATLNWYLPAGMIGFVGWAATIAEIVLAVGLLVGWQLRWSALFSAALLFVFGVTMVMALGVKAPLSYSVFSAASAAFLLFAIQPSGDASCTPINGEGAGSVKCPPPKA
jgi:uncharacterized membrane protein YphA (DoxX/SURF4 family)